MINGALQVQGIHEQECSGSRTLRIIFDMLPLESFNAYKTLSEGREEKLIVVHMVNNQFRMSFRSLMMRDLRPSQMVNDGGWSH